MGQTKSKYEARSHEEIKTNINKYGICFVPKVLDSTEITNMITGTWDYFEHVTANDEEPILMSDPRSWSNIQTLFPSANMLFHKYSSGHSPHMWELRQNEKVLSIWSKLLNCNYKEMLVSFDGFSFLLPPEETNESWHNDNETWYHVDQTLTVSEQRGFQSFITAYDINENDATIRFFEKSHLLTQNFVNKFGIIEQGDWVRFNDEHVSWYKSICPECDMICPAGSMVIWDSRLVHYGGKPRRGRANKNTKCTAYLSYSPSYMIDEPTRNQKIHGFLNKLTSNHYAHRASFFEQGSMIDINPLDTPQLSEIGYLLAGYTFDDTLRILN